MAKAVLVGMVVISLLGFVSFCWYVTCGKPDGVDPSAERRLREFEKRVRNGMTRDSIACELGAPDEETRYPVQGDMLTEVKYRRGNRTITVVYDRHDRVIMHD